MLKNNDLCAFHAKELNKNDFIASVSAADLFIKCTKPQVFLVKCSQGLTTCLTETVCYFR